MAFSIMTLSITIKYVTLSMTLFVGFALCVIMMSVIMMSVIMMSVIMMSVIMMSVIMMSVTYITSVSTYYGF
jgi:hypothetical protein